MRSCNHLEEMQHNRIAIEEQGANVRHPLEMLRVARCGDVNMSLLRLTRWIDDGPQTQLFALHLNVQNARAFRQVYRNIWIPLVIQVIFVNHMSNHQLALLSWFACSVQIGPSSGIRSMPTVKIQATGSQ